MSPGQHEAPGVATGGTSERLGSDLDSAKSTPSGRPSTRDALADGAR